MTNLKPSFASDSDSLAVFHEELARVARRLELPAVGPALWPRFARYYQTLGRLPRRARRTLQRKWRRSLGAIALLLALGQAPALAAIIPVATGIPDINPDGQCSLIEAIENANDDAATHADCAAGSGADTIVLPARSTQTLTEVNNRGANGLPHITSAIVIEGNGSTITRDARAPSFRILEVESGGSLTLQETTVSGGAMDSARGGGLLNYGTLTLSNSTVSGNYAFSGGGVQNISGTLTLTHSTVSGNSANLFGSGGGVYNASGTLTLTNSTVSGNSAYFGGGVYNRGSSGTLTLTNSTVSGNSAYFGGGVSNRYGTLILNETLISGNATPFVGQEVYNKEVYNRNGVTADHFNLFGSGGDAGVAGFTPGVTDLVPSVAHPAILDPALADHGGPTKTHALVAGSPAIDAVPAVNCVTTTDQRVAPRPHDGDQDSVADCDIGAFEAGAVPPPPPPPPPPPGEEQPVAAAPATPQAPSPCTGRACRIPITCNLAQDSGTQCVNRFTLFVRKRDVRLSERDIRLSEEERARAPNRIRFAATVTNIPPGQTLNVRLKLTKKGKRISKENKGKRLKGFLEIKNLAGTSVTNTPVRIKLK